MDCIGVFGVSGQSSVEAAVLLPTVMLLMALLVQPACLLYTRMVVGSTAASCARLLATLPSGSLEQCEAYALRRLAAVPEVEMFHVGGREDWRVEASCEGGVAQVCVSGHVRTLPLLGVVASRMGRQDGQGTVIEVTVSERVRPGWLGGDYDTWVSMWG